VNSFCCLDDIPTTNDFNDDHVVPPVKLAEQINIRQMPDAQNRATQEDAVRQARVLLENDNEQLKSKVSELERQISEQLSYANNNEFVLNSTIETLQTTQAKLDKQVEHDKLIDNTSKGITIVEYTLPNSNHTILSKWNLIFKNLKALNYPHKEYFKDIVPMMEFHEQDDSILILKGFSIHHKKLESIMNRLKNLLNHVQRSEQVYEQEINRNKQSVMKTIGQVHSTNSIYWKSYRNSLIKLIRNKCNEYIRKFQIYIQGQLKIFMNSCIENSALEFKREIENSTNNYIQQETFSSDIDELKTIALNEFLRDNVFLQQKSSKTKPTKESLSTLNKHIDKIKTLLATTDDYKGCELKQFQMIAPLLQRIMIYYNCFLIQLPLFDASIDLLNKIDKNTVLTIETSTGSGMILYTVTD
jgi:hypothetical protein